MNSNGDIYVTRPFLPPIEEFHPYLKEIWDSRVLTNGGKFHVQLEQALCEFLGVPYISLFCNGTVALITALQSQNITGEVITTPYSFVATAHSLLWNKNKPVFVDIEPDGLNIDPKKIEAAITPSTSAILPVHCYGNPCDTDAIQRVAENYNLKVIYDACHAFGVSDSSGSILRHGDLSVLSFHATKVFNTFEGGAIVCHDERTKKRIDRLKNFGFVDETTVAAVGINGKMSEFNAALGLVQLRHISNVMARRAEIGDRYRAALSSVRGLTIKLHPRLFNYSYFPVQVGPDFRMSRDELYELLRANNIYARRYFYPLISDFPMYRSLPSASRENLPNALTAASQIICLPIFPELSDSQQGMIVEIILGR